MNNNLFNDKRINYKDFLIVIFAWYFISFSNLYIREKDFAALLYINDLLSFAINILAHIVFLIIIYSYFNLLYDLSLADLGFKFKKNKINFKALIILFLLLTAGVSLINLNFNPPIQQGFFPLELRENSIEIIFNDLPLLFIIFISLMFRAAVEQFLFNKIIFSLFELYLPVFIASILSALFASLLFLEFNPPFIFIIFFLVLLSNYLYLISDKNLFTSIIFYSYFLSLYIVFIYGFNFMII